MSRNTWMYFYVPLQDVTKTCPEVHGCTSMSLYNMNLDNTMQFHKLQLVAQIFVKNDNRILPLSDIEF